MRAILVFFAHELLLRGKLVLEAGLADRMAAVG